MSQVISDPAEIRHFQAALRQFNSEISGSTSRIRAQLRSRGRAWRDQEHQKFAQEFEQTMRVLQHFMRTSEQHIPFLLRKAQRLEEYLHQR